jgi:replicative DNA helicase
MKGQLPPQNIELEQVVLGSVLIDTEAIHTAFPIVDENAFYVEAHAEVWKACRALHITSQPIDMMTVINQLEKNGKLERVGGHTAIIDLSMKVSSSAHIEAHCKIIQEKYILRRMISVFSYQTSKSYDDTTNAAELLDEASAVIHELSQSIHQRQEKDFSQVIDAVVDQAERVGRGEVVEFVNSPIRTLTNTIAGFRAGKVYILAARPGMGKTSFAGQCLYEASKEGAALFVSLEMTEEDIARRLFTVVNESLYADTMFSKGIRTNAERKEVQQAAADLKKLNIHIQSEFSTLQGLKTLIKSKVRAHGVKFVVVDYLQLVTPDKPLGNREQEISTISRELKKLSLELKIPILVLSQLSRKCEERGNKRPLLSDLRDSGAIEQDADAVMFLYRDSVYSGEIDDDSAEIIVAKNRNGGLGVVNCRFIGERMVYKDDSLPPNVHEVYKQTQLPTDDNPF